MIAGIFAMVLWVGMLCLVVLASSVMGAVTGFVVGAVFSETMWSLMAYLKLPVGLEPWQFGLMLGFVGGFFRGGSVKS